MTIILTGGGSGGHITPILAVAAELKQQHPDIRLVYIGQTGDSLADVASQSTAIDASYAVRAGKWRRYHGEGWQQLLDIATLLKNIRDFFYMLAGIWQSFWLLRRLKPDAVFVKGGFVGVPVGLAAAVRRVPYITHDSDSSAGLANRIIARWAVKHAVGMPSELYSYPPDKMVYTGVPVSADFVPVTEAIRTKALAQLQLDNDAQVLLITGGGLGAQRLNDAVIAMVRQLFDDYPKLVILHTAGRANQQQVQTDYNRALSPKEISRVRVSGYSQELYLYSAAADVVITRAGATSLAELAAQGAACIIVPNPVLAGGHQLKNVKHLEADKAVVVVQEGELAGQLLPAVKQLLDNPSLRKQLGSALQAYAKPQAAAELAKQILTLAEQGRADETA